MNKQEISLLLLNVAYIIGFTIYYIMIRNYEFLLYIGIMVALLVFVVAMHKKFKFGYLTLWGLTLWGILHMVGGGVRIGGEVFYALHLFKIWETSDFFILKYDQLVHGYLYFVVVFVIWDILKRNLNKDYKKWIIYLVVVLASIGIGALNEVAEFTAVLAFPETGVGGYYNTAWDIVFNSFGALLGMIVLHFKIRKQG
jgi:uncharacterized membrane protein YjdF